MKKIFNFIHTHRFNILIFKIVLLVIFFILFIVGSVTMVEVGGL